MNTTPIEVIRDAIAKLERDGDEHGVAATLRPLLKSELWEAKTVMRIPLAYGQLDVSTLEKISKDHPNEYFLKGSGVLKLIQAIRTLEQQPSTPLSGSTPSTSAAIDNFKQLMQASTPEELEAARSIFGELLGLVRPAQVIDRCRNCGGNGWEPSVYQGRIPCSFCKRGLSSKQKAWEDLTNDEIDDAIAHAHQGRVYPQDALMMPKLMRRTEARALETKLREKNERAGNPQMEGDQAEIVAEALEHADSLRVVMQDQAAETIESLCAYITRPSPRFPTMLRKMWSGGEVQEWIDRNWNGATIATK